MTRRRARIYWVCQIGGWMSWTMVGLLYALASDDRGSLWPYLPAYLANLTSAIGWTHLYRGYIRRRGWAVVGPRQLLPRVLVASFAIGVVIPYTTVPIYLVLYPDRAQVFGTWVFAAVGGTTWCVLIWNVAY